MSISKTTYSQDTIEKAKNLRIIDDAFFRLIGTRKKVCQEILRTLLDDDKLIVNSVTTQFSEISLFRSLILDALCTLGDGSLCNIEMQKNDSNNDIKRVRFHASLITTNHTNKKTSFNDIPNVKILYITEYDALNNGQAITHISRCQLYKRCYKPVDDGEDIIFANAMSKQRNKHTRLLKLFLKNDSFYDTMYPELSKAVKHYKDTKKGRDEVCKSIEEFATDRSVDAVIKTCISFAATVEETTNRVLEQFPTISKDYIASKYNIFSAEIQKNIQ